MFSINKEHAHKFTLIGAHEHFYPHKGIGSLSQSDPNIINKNNTTNNIATIHSPEYTPLSLVNPHHPKKGPFFVDVAAGDAHSVACDSEGKVYSWGCNRYV